MERSSHVFIKMLGVQNVRLLKRVTLFAVGGPGERVAFEFRISAVAATEPYDKGGRERPKRIRTRGVVVGDLIVGLGVSVVEIWACDDNTCR